MNSLLSTQNGFFGGLGIWGRKTRCLAPLPLLHHSSFFCRPVWACILFIVSGRCPGFSGACRPSLRGAFQGALNGGAALRGPERFHAGPAAGPDNSIRKTTFDGVKMPGPNDNTNLSRQRLLQNQEVNCAASSTEGASLRIDPACDHHTGIPQRARRLVKPHKAESCAMRRP